MSASAAIPAGVPAPPRGPISIPGLSPEALARLRRHPYVRLALNGSFGALWSGQLISLFGDRVHQVAIAAIVFVLTDSPIAVAFVFVAATLPNLLFGPIAGTLVDRWDHREVLVVSDILRAAVVVIMPIAATVNLWLVYPLAFLLTSISIFFRPARVAILPRLVREDELLTANSALWIGETMADVIGFPLAGLFVALVADAVSIAFWFDGATYLASALLLSTLIPRPMPREEAPPTAGEPAPAGFRAELVAGWRFLRNDPVLLANTLQAAVAQLTVGVLFGQTLVFAERVFGSAGAHWITSGRAIGPTGEASGSERAARSPSARAGRAAWSISSSASPARPPPSRSSRRTHSPWRPGLPAASPSAGRHSLASSTALRASGSEPRRLKHSSMSTS